MKNMLMCAFLVGGLIGGSGAYATTLCVRPSAAKPQPEQLMYVKSDDLQLGRVLLGLDGSRVPVSLEWAPEPHGQLWFARVDWKKYQLEPSHSPTVSVLSFDTDEKGKRYLCSVDTRDYTASYVERNAGLKKPAPVGAGDIEVVAQTRLSYDERGRLAAAIQHERAYGEVKLGRVRTACYHYDVNDHFLGASFPDAETCAHAKPEQIRDRFVYQADGGLLRKISVEQRMIERDGKEVLVDNARITVFNAHREPKAEYATDEMGLHYRRNLTAKTDDNNYHAVKTVRSAASINLNHLQNGKAIGFWQIHSVPSAVANASDSSYDDRYLVVRRDKPVLNDRDRQKIWAALIRPGYDTVLDGQGTFLLVPEVSTSTWEACTNPQLVSAKDCP